VVGGNRKVQITGNDGKSGSIGCRSRTGEVALRSYGCVIGPYIGAQPLRAPALQGSSLPIAGFLAGLLSGE
jgi:hypothetical protein